MVLYLKAVLVSILFILGLLWIGVTGVIISLLAGPSMFRDYASKSLTRLEWRINRTFG